LKVRVLVSYQFLVHLKIVKKVHRPPELPVDTWESRPSVLVFDKLIDANCTGTFTALKATIP
jgi:hypothetical protein